MSNCRCDADGLFFSAIRRSTGIATDAHRFLLEPPGRHKQA
jgi:hypothetical protein